MSNLDTVQNNLTNQPPQPPLSQITYVFMGSSFSNLILALNFIWDRYVPISLARENLSPQTRERLESLSQVTGQSLCLLLYPIAQCEHFKKLIALYNNLLDNSSKFDDDSPETRQNLVEGINHTLVALNRANSSISSLHHNIMYQLQQNGILTFQLNNRTVFVRKPDVFVQIPRDYLPDDDDSDSGDESESGNFEVSEPLPSTYDSRNPLQCKCCNYIATTIQEMINHFMQRHPDKVSLSPYGRTHEDLLEIKFLELCEKLTRCFESRFDAEVNKMIPIRHDYIVDRISELKSMVQKDSENMLEHLIADHYVTNERVRTPPPPADSRELPPAPKKRRLE
jgi:hypothetical protein